MALALEVLCLLVAPLVIPAPNDWRVEGGQAGAHLGSALATGDFNDDGFGDLLIGIPDHDGEAVNTGRVALHLGSNRGLSLAASWTMAGHQAQARFGSVLAVADVNGDGFDDALIGAPSHDTGRNARARRSPGGGPVPAGNVDQGRVWIVLGTPTGLASQAQRILSGLEPGERFGTSLASARDVNGDGYGDVIVGATGSAGGRGRIQVFPGSAAGLVATPIWNRLGIVGAGWGSVVGTAGDLNADGFADILVSANQFGGPCGNQDVSTFGATRDFDLDGRPESFYLARCGSPSSRVVLRDFLAGTAGNLNGSNPFAVTAGDLNGDGRVDLVVSQPTFQYESFYGRVFVYTNLPSSYPPVGAFPLYDGGQAEAGWGEALASIDVDGDGADELFVGAPRHDAGETDEGLVVLFPGRSQEVSVAETDDSPLASATCVGDFDGDGFSDLAAVTGSTSTDASVAISYGTASGLGEIPALLVLPPPPQPREFRALGLSVGDGDGDGFDDLVLRSYTYDTAHGGDFGEWVYAYYRGSAGGVGPTLSSSMATGPSFIGDVTGDGFDDALDGNVVYLGSATGLYPAQTLPTDAGYNQHFGDLDGDGLTDMVTRLIQSQNLAVYLGTPSGLTLDQTWWGFPQSASPNVIGLLDVNGDGRDDLLTYYVGDSNKCRVWARTASGFERAPQWWESPVPPCCDSSATSPRIIAVLDADQDGFKDLLIYTANSNQGSLHTGSSEGISRAQAWAGALPSGSIAFATSDFDGDGDLEILTQGFSTVRVIELDHP